jgi:uncharacterized protein GlcG (DUF336 family)
MASTKSSSSKTPLTVSPPTLTLAAARLATAAAESHSHTINVPMNIAVVDSATHLLSFSRMPNAKTTSISIAIDKAFTAAGHRAPTHVYKEAVWPGGPAYGINGTNGGRFNVIGGGVPIVHPRTREVLGAVGCSTGTPAQDRECAEAGARAVVKALEEEDSGRVKAKL